MAGIFDLTGFLTPLVAKLTDEIPDPVERAKAREEATTQMLQFVTQQNQAQLAVDQAEANNKNVFVAGWRPAIGWACGAAFTWQYVAEPVAQFTLAAFGHPVVLPVLNIGDMMPVLMGMLGLGGMRTYEKVTGVAAKTAQ